MVHLRMGTSALRDSITLRTIPNVGRRLIRSFIVGTSSSLFNQVLLNLPSGNESTAQSILENVLQVFSQDEEDIAVYPNPFKAINGSSNTVSTFPNLTLVDGVLPLLFRALTFSGRRSSKCAAMAAFAARTECRLYFCCRFQCRYTELAKRDFLCGNVPEIHAQCYKRCRLPICSRTTNVSDARCYGVDLRFVNLGLNSRPTFFG